MSYIKLSFLLLLCIYEIQTSLFSNQTLAVVLKELSIDQNDAYQDIIIDGKTIFNGLGPKCSERFALIEPYLLSFPDAFSVLDVGANNGYFPLQIAYKFDKASCVMIDISNRLKKILDYNPKVKHRIRYLQKYINATDLEKMAEETHFDVVIALNIVRFFDSWKRGIDALLKLGNIVFIEIAPSNDPRALKDTSIPEIDAYVSSLPNGQLIGRIQRVASNSIGKTGVPLSLDKVQAQERILLPEVYSKFFVFTSK